MKQKTTLALLVIINFMSFTGAAFAFTTYAPGETIDPSCAPTPGDCYVDFSDNGLTQTTNGIGLGGTLNTPTVIDQDGNDFSFINGNVGINNPTPLQTLDVIGTSSVFVDSYSDALVPFGVTGSMGSISADDFELPTKLGEFGFSSGNYSVVNQAGATFKSFAGVSQLSPAVPYVLPKVSLYQNDSTNDMQQLDSMTFVEGIGLLSMYGDTASVLDETNFSSGLYTSFINARSSSGAPRVSFGVQDNVLSKGSEFYMGTDSTALGINSINRFNFNAVNLSTSLGLDAYASGQKSMAFGDEVLASGDYSLSIGGSGPWTGFTPTRATAEGGIAISTSAGALASGAYGIAIGNTDNPLIPTQASGMFSVAIGPYANAAGDYSIALGASSALGQSAVAFGDSNSASGNQSTAFGGENTANGQRSTAWGSMNTAIGDASTAWGETTVADGYSSTAWGQGTSTYSYVETALGCRNTSYSPLVPNGYDVRDRLFTIGNGCTGANLNSDALTVLKNGQVGIGIDNFETNAVPSSVFQVGDNTINVIGYVDNGTGNWVAVSDERKKENITDISYGLDTIMSLSPKSYTMKSTGEQSIGFIAQQTKDIVPEAVFGSEEKGYGMSYSTLVPVLTRAVQQLADKVERVTTMLYDLVAETVTARRGTFQELCVGSTCVTEAQLIQLLQNNSVAPAAQSGGSTSAGSGGASGSGTDTQTGDTNQTSTDTTATDSGAGSSETTSDQGSDTSSDTPASESPAPSTQESEPSL